jgi:hypothetical protein
VERRIENSIPLLILTGDALKDLTARAGLTDISLHGSFEEAPYGTQSHILVLTASKNDMS